MIIIITTIIINIVSRPGQCLVLHGSRGKWWVGQLSTARLVSSSLSSLSLPPSSSMSSLSLSSTAETSDGQANRSQLDRLYHHCHRCHHCHCHHSNLIPQSLSRSGSINQSKSFKKVMADMMQPSGTDMWCLLHPDTRRYLHYLFWQSVKVILLRYFASTERHHSHSSLCLVTVHKLTLSKKTWWKSVIEIYNLFIERQFIRSFYWKD